MSEIIKGYWNELQGDARITWGKLTQNELEQVAGNAKKLEGLLQQRYGLAIEEARKEVAALQSRFDNLTRQGEWNQVKGQIQKFWGEISENDLDRINGSKTRLLGFLQENLNRTKEEALEEVDKFFKRIS